MSEPRRMRERTYECGLGRAGASADPSPRASRESEVFMRYLVALGFSVSVVGGVLSGCVADHASAIDESENELDTVNEPDKPANPDDPFGSCEDFEDDGVDHPTCSIPGMECNGWGDFGGCTDGVCEYARRWHWCHHSCEEASECPVPATGDAVPECIIGGCILPCDDEGTLCPDGFICESMSVIDGWIDAYDRVCVQYYSVEPYVPLDPDLLW